MCFGNLNPDFWHVGKHALVECDSFITYDSLPQHGLGVMSWLDGKVHHDKRIPGNKGAGCQEFAYRFSDVDKILQLLWNWDAQLLKEGSSGFLRLHKLLKPSSALFVLSCFGSARFRF